MDAYDNLNRRFGILLLIFFCLGLMPYNSFSQDSDSLHISGVVYSKDMLAKLSGVSIHFGQEGVFSDAAGKFSVWVHNQDTLSFSYVGFQPLRVTITDSLRNANVGFGVFLVTDTIELNEVVVFSRDTDEPETKVETNHSGMEIVFANKNVQMALFTAQRTNEISSMYLADKNQSYQNKQFEMSAINAGAIPYNQMVNITLVFPFSRAKPQLLHEPGVADKDPALSFYEENLLMNFIKSQQK